MCLHLTNYSPWQLHQSRGGGFPRGNGACVQTQRRETSKGRSGSVATRLGDGVVVQEQGRKVWKQSAYPHGLWSCQLPQSSPANLSPVQSAIAKMQLRHFSERAAYVREIAPSVGQQRYPGTTVYQLPNKEVTCQLTS